jgi:CxxC-x17-CxxC domain-containing protein
MLIALRQCTHNDGIHRQDSEILNCGEDFVFSAGEQVFFREMQFQHVPRHCKKCNAKHRNARGRVETSVTCSECGASTTVPFLPHLGHPVLCRSCFQWRRRDALLHPSGGRPES